MRRPPLPRRLAVPVIIAALTIFFVPPPSGGSAPATRTASTAVSGASAKQLPLGGTRILGRYRVVTYYGGAGGPGLGVLGSKSPDRIAADIRNRAARWRRYGRTVQPAMELIATVAQGSPGADGSYSRPIAATVLHRYLRAAHRNRMLLILDFQPGRAAFISQVRRFGRVLTDPWVSVALDPEWKMTRQQVPGRTIGHAWAHGINVVGAYLAGIVKTHALPDKLLVVHQFTTAMLPNRNKIRTARGVEVLFHADGFGSPAAKRATWHRLAFPGRPYGAGFKLFLRQDRPLMTPGQVMALRPSPDLISYQ